ncbi:hypothetical protein [Paenibacillus sp. RC21]
MAHGECFSFGEIADILGLVKAVYKNILNEHK